MASGDDIEAGRTTGAEDRTILVAQKSTPSKDFVGDFVFKAAPARAGSRLTPDRDIDGVFGIGNRGGRGVVGVGGFQDRADSTVGATGVFGKGGEVAVKRIGGTGVTGQGGGGSLQAGGIGVFGRGGTGNGGFPDGPGVFGSSASGDGVVGMSATTTKSGVFGFNPSSAGVAFGVFGRCDSPNGAGVAGRNVNGEAVSGFSDGNIGVAGTSGAYIGVYGLGPHMGLEAEGGNAGALAFSPTGHGVIGIAHTRGKYAGAFSGDVLIAGSLTVLGAVPKSAAVRVGKEYRRLYTMESPESWFEDFGEASLRRGRATVRLPADFAPLVHTNGYHVFVTPHGDCGGLFVSSRTRTQFEVRELNGGRSSVGFSYRIVAKRKDIPGKRLEKVKLPDLPKPAGAARGTVPTRRDDARRLLLDRNRLGAQGDAARKARSK